MGVYTHAKTCGHLCQYRSLQSSQNAIYLESQLVHQILKQPRFPWKAGNIIHESPLKLLTAKIWNIRLCSFFVFLIFNQLSKAIELIVETELQKIKLFFPWKICGIFDLCYFIYLSNDLIHL